MPELTSGQGYIDDASEALEVDNVYVSSEVPDAAALHDMLDVQVGDASIGIAVFSDNAALEASGPDIVAELAAAHPDCETVIVAVGDDLSAGSRVLDPGEAMRIANGAESSASDLESALTQTVQEVIAATPVDAGGSGADVGAIVGFSVAGVILLGAIVGAVALVLGLRRSRRRDGMVHALPAPVTDPVERLRALSGEYAALAASGNPVAVQMAPQVAGIAGNASELFERLGRRGDEEQRTVAAAEYGETLRRLTAALDRDYLLDILRRPDLWDDPDERIREVQDATTEVSEQLVANIKQLNARRGLHFQVSLDGLMGRRKELRDWERAFGSASGDEPAASV